MYNIVNTNFMHTYQYSIVINFNSIVEQFNIAFIYNYLIYVYKKISELGVFLIDALLYNVS